MFRRLRDDLFDGKILAVGMIRLGGIELQKGAPWECSLNSGAFAAQTVNWNFTVEKRRDNWSNQTTRQRQGFRVVRVGTKTKHEQFSTAKDFLATATERIDLNIYIVGAGA